MFVWIYRDKRIIHSLENISLCFLKFMLISSITCCIQATVHRLQGLHPGSPPNTASSFLTPPHVWSAPQVLILQLQSAKKSSCTGPSFFRSLDTALVSNALDSIKPPKGCAGIHTYIMTEVWRDPSAAAKKHILSVPHLSALIFVCGKKTAGTLCKVHFKIIEWLLYSK